MGHMLGAGQGLSIQGPLSGGLLFVTAPEVRRLPRVCPGQRECDGAESPLPTSGPAPQTEALPRHQAILSCRRPVLRASPVPLETPSGDPGPARGFLLCRDVSPG